MANYLVLIYENEAQWAAAEPSVTEETTRRHWDFAKANGAALRGGDARVARILELEIDVRLTAVELRLRQPPMRIRCERARERDGVLEKPIERLGAKVARRDRGVPTVDVEVEAEAARRRLGHLLHPSVAPGHLDVAGAVGADRRVGGALLLRELGGAAGDL